MLKTFLSRFATEFGTKVWPTLTLHRVGAPDSIRTVQAIGSFRDAICVVAIVEHAHSLKWKRGLGIRFSDAFDIYPWFLGRDFDEHLSAAPYGENVDTALAGSRQSNRMVVPKSSARTARRPYRAQWSSAFGWTAAVETKNGTTPKFTKS